MRFCLSVIIAILYSSLGYAAAPCPYALKSDDNARLMAVSQKSCEDLKKSPQCQAQYAKIKSAGDNPDDMALHCDYKGKDFDTEVNLASADYIVGCAIGGWNYAKDTVTSIIDLYKKSAADTAKEVAANAACNKDINLKKALYSDYNNSVPKLLRIQVPTEGQFEHFSCEQLKANLLQARLQQARQAGVQVMPKMNQSNPNFTPDEKEFVTWRDLQMSKGDSGPGILQLAKNQITEMGIKIECYNSRQAAAITCEAIAAVGTFAAGPAGAALKAARVARLAGLAGEVSDVAKVAEVASAGSTVAGGASDLEKVAKLSDVDRIAGAEKTLGRSFSDTEKSALIDAHNVGAGTGRGIGSYSNTDILQKAKKLKDGGFSAADRKTLLDDGYAGSLSDTRAARDASTDMRLKADKLKAAGQVTDAQKVYANAADSNEVFMQDARFPKSDRDFATAADLNASAGRYDKAAEYYIKKYDKLNFRDRGQEMFLDLREQRDALRRMGTSSTSTPAAKQNYQNFVNMIQALLKRKDVPGLNDAQINELLKS